MQNSRRCKPHLESTHEFDLVKVTDIDIPVTGKTMLNEMICRKKHRNYASSIIFYENYDNYDDYVH